jgi:putative transposase
VILGICSRYAVGWMVATRESAARAEKLIAATCAKQGITSGQLSIHAGRGSSMTSKPVALLLADLGITQSRLPGRTARTSSPGTTTSTATAASACTPPPTSNGRAPAIQAARAQVLEAAYHAHPERFVAKPPTPPELPGTCWINPPPEKEAAPQ